MKNIKKRRNICKNKKDKQEKPLTSDLSDKDEDVDTMQGSREEPENNSRKKRILDGDDESDSEDKPRKKKKKKPAPAQSNEQGKGKKSIRQMKREKHAQRQAEAEFVAKDSLKQQCLSYLSKWKHARDQWKFMKAKQVWLYKNKFVANLVPEESWTLLLEYFDSAKGNIRNMLLEDANKVIKQMDDYLEKESNQTEDPSEAGTESSYSKPDETCYRRARDIIQHLQ